MKKATKTKLILITFQRTPLIAAIFGDAVLSTFNFMIALEKYKSKGERHFLLAMLASFPVFITADLLYRLWQHFGKSRNIPRVAVSDLLLSNILEESSTDMFEYEPELREELLQSLKEYFTALGNPNILQKLAFFMSDYAKFAYSENFQSPVREMEEWNALAYYDPATVNRQIAEARNTSNTNNCKIRAIRARIVAEFISKSEHLRIQPILNEPKRFQFSDDYVMDESINNFCLSNKELIVLVDRKGSMLAFRALSDFMVETIKKEIPNANIYYFRNQPQEYFYGSPDWTEAITQDNLTEKINKSNANVLVISDGGAARGTYVTARLQAWYRFFKDIGEGSNKCTWFNPMPKTRWTNTTANYMPRLFNVIDGYIYNCR